MRNIDTAPGETIVNLLKNRYLPGDVSHPRRSYAYVSGRLKEFNGVPEVEVADVKDFADGPP